MEKKRRSNVRTSSKDLPVAANKTSTDFDPDYSHVIRNLKRIGVLAVIFISILIALSFIL